LPGTSSHTRIRISGKGIKRVNTHGYGDHYVHIKVQIPSSLTPEQKELMLAYAELEKDTPGTINGVVKTRSGSHRLEPSLT
jgi:DnaJ family protein A protein 3